jgi:predicted DNA-binding transcriptional regulator AlpA
MIRLLTVDEVAAMLRRSPAQLRYMRGQGTAPPSAKIAGRIMFREEEVLTYIEAQFDSSADAA